MRNNILVSIGLCVQNSEATVKKALNSILNQDFSHDLMELIIVDGCSEDCTLSIIKESLINSDIKRRIFTENTGLGMARQIVVDQALGNYIIWVDDDIILSNDYVRNQVEFMEDNPKVGIAEGRYGRYDAESLVAYLENIMAVLQSNYREKNPSKSVAATEGAVWRVKAIRQVGGFDVSIKGAAEDTEATHRVRAAGWLLTAIDARYYELCRGTWKSFWNQYCWYGYGAHFLFHKDRNIIKLYQMLPQAGFIAGVYYSFNAYKLTHRKIVFLLPIHYFFKRTAWFFGFIKAHTDGYGH